MAKPAAQKPPAEEFLEKSRVLIVDSVNTSRNAIRKTLAQIGAKSASVDAVDNYSDAMASIEKTMPEVLICDQELGDHSGVELINHFRKVKNDRLRSAMFLITGRSSPMLTCLVAEQEIDGLIVKPFTADSLIKSCQAVFANKMAATPYQILVEEGRGLFDLGKIPESKEKFEAAIAKIDAAKQEGGTAYAYLAKIALLDQKSDEAVAHFESGLSKNSKNYKCLVGIVDLLMERKEWDRAFTHASVLTKEFPVNPRRLPTLIRLAIQSHHFEEISKFKDVIEQIPETLDPTLVKYISAGLVVAGKYLFRNNMADQALPLLKHAAILSPDKVHILREVLMALIVGGRRAEASDLLQKMKPEVKDHPDIQLVDLEFVFTHEEPSLAFTKAQELRGRGMKAPRIHEIMIILSKKLGRKPESIAELIEEAKGFFPDIAEHFEGLK